jgi:membrane associated rhomboid family serine protease
VIRTSGATGTESLQKQQHLDTDDPSVARGFEPIETRIDPAFEHPYSDRVDAAALLPDSPSGAPAAPVKIYAPKSGTQWRLALIASVLGACGLIPLKRVIDWLSGGPRPGGGEFLALTGAVFFLPIALLCVANALRGLPRLTMTPRGIKLDGGIRTKWADWDSVGPFAVKIVYSRRSSQVRAASAKLARSDTGRSGRRARTITIPDQFTVPIDTIAAELNAARARATGDTTPVPAAPEITEAAIGLAQFKIPWLTFALLTLLVAIFALENVFSVTPGGKELAPSIATLVAFGASSHNLVVAHHQWYRLFTAPLLHANFAHILGNGVALLWGGWLLERLVGRLWYFALFFIGALCGSLFSLAVNPPNLVSVGASGALMGLFAALFVGSFRYASGNARRTRLQLSSLRIIVPSLLPLFSTSSVERIDYGAHIGGALSGAAVTLLLLKCWPEGAPIPQLRKTAATISAVGAFLFAASGLVTLALYPKYYQALHHARSAQPAKSGTASPNADVLSDHGPKRVACDTRWSALPLRDPGAYEAFLQRCMSEGPANP